LNLRGLFSRAFFSGPLRRKCIAYPVLALMSGSRPLVEKPYYSLKLLI
jgi:hypothetical protein